jgi:hypothetical protein
VASQTDPTDEQSEANDLGSRLSKRARRLWQDGRPELERLIERARPLATSAGKDAIRYAREHEDEIKRTALRGARLHMRGPFGYMIGTFADAAARGAGEQPQRVLCASCEADNPGGARFCNQCGARLATKPPN